MTVWNDIAEVNSQMELTPIEKSGKKNDYATVKERVIAFRKLYPNGQITSEIIDRNRETIIIKATAYDDGGKVLATGYAMEQAGRHFALENCETSAIGRCLGFCGLGISTSIAPADDIERDELFDEPDINILVTEFQSLYSKASQTQILNGLHVKEPREMGTDLLVKYVTYAKEHNTGQ